MTIKKILFGSRAYEQMVELRISVLLSPIGVPASYIEPQQESKDVFIGAFEKDELVGCCVLTKKTNESIQLRQMAVKKSVQGKGAGRAIIRFAEDEARNLNYRQLILNARDPVIGFYTKCGYEIRSEQFFEVGLAHHEMSKQLTTPLFS
jgi:predicted GNAT family N-acyltransferase